MTHQIDEIGLWVSSFARQRKESAAGDTDPMLLAVRQGSLLALLEGPDVGAILGVAPLAAAGYGADALALVFEGVRPDIEINPVTGHTWQKGEADAVRLDHDGIARGWVSEILVVAIVCRDNTEYAAAQEFSTADGSIVWGDVEVQPKEIGVEHALRAALTRPAADPARVQDPGDSFVASADSPFYSPEMGRVVLDVGCTRLLDRELRGGGASLICHDDQEAVFWRSQGLQSWQIAYPFDPAESSSEAGNDHPHTPTSPSVST